MKSVTWCTVLLWLMIATAGTAFGADRSAESVAMAEKAATLILEKGREYALKVFSASKGPFVDGELYVFACSMNNVLLAHPFSKELTGQDVSGLKDVKGFPLFQAFKKVATEKGSGWVDYWWPKPGEKGEFAKTSFIKCVPGADIYVGVGFYR
jgi:cytochrome c